MTGIPASYDSWLEEPHQKHAADEADYERWLDVHGIEDSGQAWDDYLEFGWGACDDHEPDPYPDESVPDRTDP